MRNRPLLFALTLPIAAAFALSSCANKNVKTGAAGKADMTTDTATTPAVEIQESTDTMSTESDIRGGDFQPQADIKTINFEFDKYELSDAIQAVLQSNATLLKVHKDWSVLVEGHCDNRGTIEYNLALGQKRAKAVRDYYVRLGVPENSVGTISYGEEKPLCNEETDACWAQNRRAETKVIGK